LTVLENNEYKKIMEYFKIILGYGYHCVKCNKIAKIIQVCCSEYGNDFVTWRCSTCKKIWSHEFKDNSIRTLLK